MDVLAKRREYKYEHARVFHYAIFTNDSCCYEVIINYLL